MATNVFTHAEDTNASNVPRTIVECLASLKFTVVLLAMGIFIVFAGTLAQTENDIWLVVDQYFRCNYDVTVPLIDRVISIPSFAWIENKIFFPPSFFPNPLMEERPDVSGGFYFPGGWMIGMLMAINLMAAHGIRFKAQAKGSQLGLGVLVIAIGLLMTWTVVQSGSNADGLHVVGVEYSTVWKILLGGVGLTAIVAFINAARMESTRKLERRTLGVGGLLLAGLLGWLTLQDGSGQLGESSMRILWQLLKATFAGIVLLVGCYMVFKKRAGIVLLHFGIGLMMFSELLVGTTAVETQMRLAEGETRSFVHDIREFELAVIDSSDPEEDKVVAIPASMLTDEEETDIEHESLPFNVEVVRYFKNSDLNRVKPDDNNPADAGWGTTYIAKELERVSGIGDEIDVPSFYLRFTDKESGRVLGTHLLSLWLTDAEAVSGQTVRPETITVDATPYDVFLRFRRYHKPYAVTLKDVRKLDYVGTDTPRDYSSVVQLVDSSRDVDREIRIWMNNPLRFAGETFYQSGYMRDPNTGDEITTLSVVTNTGWMIPYVSCMIVIVGMTAQFLMTLVRFLDRRNRQSIAVGVSSSAEPTAEDNETTGQFSGPLSENADITETQSGSRLTAPTVVVPLAIVALFAFSIARGLFVPKAVDGEYNLYAFGELPVAYQGRTKPIDTLARNSLRIITDRQDFTDAEGEKQSAIRWLLDVAARPEEAAKHPVFRVEDLELLSTLGLERRKGFRYSLEEIRTKPDELREQVELARKKDAKQLTRFERKVLELSQQVQVVEMLRIALARPRFDTTNPHESLLTFAMQAEQLDGQKMPLAIPDVENEDKWHPLHSVLAVDELREYARSVGAENAEQLAKRLRDSLPSPRESVLGTLRLLQPMVVSQAREEGVSVAEFARERAMRISEPHLRETLLMIASADADATPDEIVDSQSEEALREIATTRALLTIVQSLPPRLVKPVTAKITRSVPTPDAIDGYIDELTLAAVTELIGDGPIGDVNPQAESLKAALAAWESQDVNAFNGAVEDYNSATAAATLPGLNIPRVKFESWFNHAGMFFHLIFVYLSAAILALVAWLVWPKMFNRSAFWLIAFTFVIHTLALCGRIYISGRPPVTNLYSSAVFIGWGCVALGMVLEVIYKLGVGNIIAASAGAATLGIAHQLAGDGDTFAVLQAVLDTQFWLATHVVCITLGYSMTFVAGFLGILYVIVDLTGPIDVSSLRKELARMIYGTLCFALLFSFFGTVLGGLWADDSWGRFWGWDPKENGALMIVLWNALVLHARWDGMAKARGMAILAIVGNICTAWSWFGVNELGVGLHSYGFTEGVLRNLGWFVISQLAFVGLGCLTWILRSKSARTA